MVGPKFGQYCNHLTILMCCLITNLAVPRFFVEVFLSSIVTYGMRTWAPKILWFTFLLDYYLETIKNVLFSGPTIFPNVFQVGPEKMKVKDNLKDISTKSSPPGFLKGIFQSFPEEGYQPSTNALNIIHD